MKKRFLILAAAMMLGAFTGTASFAEEAVSAETQTTVWQSEDSATGYYVTFRYEDEEAERVRLCGNFCFTDYLNASMLTSLNASPFEWEDGYFNYGDNYYIDMEKNEETGVWEVTIPLPNGTYSYNFYVGGSADAAVDDVEDAEKVYDPAHPGVSSGIGDSFGVGSSTIYVPRDEEKQAESLNLEIEAPREDGQAGEYFFESLTYNEAEIPFGVYLPTGYDADREEAYPVLVMLHGGGGNESNWFNDGLTNIMDNLIADYGLEDTIVVTPSWIAINKVSENAFEGLYEFLADELYPYISETYHGAEDSAHRALAGLSQGGARTMYMAYYHVDLCDYYFAYSCPWDTDDHGTPELDAADYEDKTIFLGCGLYDFVIAECYLVEQDTESPYYSAEESFFKHMYTLYNAGISYYSWEEPSFGHSWQTWRQLAAYSIGTLLWK